MATHQTFANPARARAAALDLLRLTKPVELIRYSTIRYQLVTDAAIRPAARMRDKFIFNVGWRTQESRPWLPIRWIQSVTRTTSANRFVVSVAVALVIGLLVLGKIALETMAPVAMHLETASPVPILVSNQGVTIGQSYAQACQKRQQRLEQKTIEQLLALTTSNNLGLVVTDEYSFGGVKSLIAEFTCAGETKSFEIKGANRVKPKWARLD